MWDPPFMIHELNPGLFRYINPCKNFGTEPPYDDTVADDLI